MLPRANAFVILFTIYSDIIISLIFVQGCHCIFYTDSRFAQLFPYQYKQRTTKMALTKLNKSFKYKIQENLCDVLLVSPNTNILLFI